MGYRERKTAIRVSLAAVILAFIAAASMFLAHPPTAAATDPARWARHAAAPTVPLDDRPWAAFLARYVQEHPDGVNRVDYGGVTAADRARLKSWLAAMQTVDVARLTRAQQMAFWINLYNAATLDVVLDAYPVESIRHVRGGLLGRGPWREKLLSMGGERLSLDDIEHHILRRIWRDPRIHFAVNCASIGCPNLRREPFRAEALNTQLDEAATAFVNHGRAFHATGGRLRASSIYDWYAGDFGGPAGVLTHGRRYARGPQAAALRAVRAIDSYGYDWRLNDVRAR